MEIKSRSWNWKGSKGIRSFNKIWKRI